MPPTTTRLSFFQTISAAVADIVANGFDSEERVRRWLDAIRLAAEAQLISTHVLESTLNATLGAVYDRLIVRGGAIKHHPGVDRFTIQRLAPQLRAELDRRVMASANLIKLNRQQAIEQTLRRFAGLASSIPAGGTRAADKREAAAEVRKSMASLPFVERRVLIDQGAKFTSAVNATIARAGNAIAMVWHSHWRSMGYDYREDHKERDERIYMIRGNWALARGLVKAGPDGYTDQITAPAEEVFCRCKGTYLYSLRDLPEAMLTAKGRGELQRVRVA